MGKQSEYNAGRNDGLAMALMIVERDGVDALREEIQFRGVTGIHTALAKKELDKATHQIKERTLSTMLVISVATLHDEFEFGAKRCQRFIDRMNLKAECLVDDMATWGDYIKTIEKEIGIKMRIKGGVGNNGDCGNTSPCGGGGYRLCSGDREAFPVFR